MRIATSTRWLVAAVAAVAVTSSVHAQELNGNHNHAGVVAAAKNDGPARISVNVMAATSPITFADATTPTTAPPTGAATTAPSAATIAPLTPASTTTTTAPSTGSGDGAAPVIVGAPVTCAFRYSLPTTSNLAAELAAQAANQKNKKKNTTTPGTSGSSNTNNNNTPSSAGSGGASPGTDGTTPSTSAPNAGGGSGAGDTLPSAGSADAGTGPQVTQTPSPTTTTTAPTATTRTPSTTTTTPSATTKAPATPTNGGAGSSDGAGLTGGRMLQTNAGDLVPTTTTPKPTTKKPTATTAPATTAPPPTTTTMPTADGSGGGATPTTPTTTTSSSSSGSSSGASGTTKKPLPSSSSSSSASAAGSSSGSAAAAAATTKVVTGEFTCDATFYGTWSTLGLQCGGTDLNVATAVAQSQCLIYSGVQSTSVAVDIKMCMSLCKFPKCANGTWDYSADDGFTSNVYRTLKFGDLIAALGKKELLDATATSALSSLSFKTDRECAYTGESSFKSCQCENLQVSGGGGASSSNSGNTTPLPAKLTPAVDKGLGDANHWPDGLAKTAIDKVGIASAAIGTSAAAVSVAAGAVMSVAGSVMGTSAGVAGGVSATASMGLAMVAVDICQFSVMVNQMNLDATPRVLQEMGKRMSPSAFSFLPFGQVESSTNGTNSSSSLPTVSRRLMDVTNTNQTLGMERYAALIGVKVDMLFYLTLAGVMIMCVAPFVLCALFVVCAAPFVASFRDFARKWVDKTVGVLMMILILSEYVVGVTATFQICYLIKYDKIDAGMYLAIFSLVFFAVGTILYGIWVVQRHEDELRDLGTKDHFEKPVHAKYGPLYDEYKFEGRYFFAPKLLLALLCGVTTGFIGMPGIWQVIVLISLHIAFLLYMEVKRPFPSAFVQKTSSFVIIIKISALFLTLFLISSATSLQGEIPVDLREGVGFAIIGLQVLVLVCLMVRQMYIFYITWKLKRQEDDAKEMGNTNHSTESFHPLGGDLSMLYNTSQRQNQNQQQQYPNQSNHHDQFAMLDGSSGRASTPLQYEQQHTHQYAHHSGNTTPDRFRAQPTKLRGLQPAPMAAQGMRRTHTVVVHNNEQGPTPNNNYRRHQNEISL